MWSEQFGRERKKGKVKKPRTRVKNVLEPFLTFEVKTLDHNSVLYVHRNLNQVRVPRLSAIDQEVFGGLALLSGLVENPLVSSKHFRLDIQKPEINYPLSSPNHTNVVQLAMMRFDTRFRL